VLVVTRPGKPPRRRALARLVADDPVAAVLLVLQRAEEPLTAAGIKAALEAGGVAKDDADRAWRAVQRKLASSDSVVVEDRRYRWAEQPGPVSATEALDLLGQGRLPAARRAELLDILREALAADHPDDAEEAARRRQAEIDAVRALAELASEAEELAVNEARTEALVHRVRARVKRSGLEPIGRAGDETTFDRKRHKPISGSIRDGAPVIVVRPGYIWRSPAEDVLVVKAVVEE
jgi:hypothetical protein